MASDWPWRVRNKGKGVIVTVDLLLQLTAGLASAKSGSTPRQEQYKCSGILDREFKWLLAFFRSENRTCCLNGLAVACAKQRYALMYVCKTRAGCDSSSAGLSRSTRGV